MSTTKASQTTTTTPPTAPPTAPPAAPPNAWRKALPILVLTLLGILALACRSGFDVSPENYTRQINNLWADSPASRDWALTTKGRDLIPHGDADGKESYEQKYYVQYTSMKVPGFTMNSFVDIPANDSRPLSERVNGYFELGTSRVEQLPDSVGFMKLVASEHQDLALVGFIEDGTLTQKYPGKRVYRLKGQNLRDLPQNPNAGSEGAATFDWAKVYEDSQKNADSGPLVGYDSETKKWVTLEPGKPAAAGK